MCDDLPVEIGTVHMLCRFTGGCVYDIATISVITYRITIDHGSSVC
jgi:hypothetical protein